MQTQPHLLLLQKVMVVAEGVGRVLHPEANMWQLARPLIEDWIIANTGPEARLRDFAEESAQLLRRLPRLAERAEAAFERIAALPAPPPRRAARALWPALAAAFAAGAVAAWAVIRLAGPG